MTPLEGALWHRIVGFCFDHGETVLSFAARLVEEVGWNWLCVLRVLDECRQFTFLLAAASHMVDAVVLLIGLARIIVGISRDKLVGFWY